MLNNRIIIYAFRYALGRQTGSVSDVCDCIKENVDSFKSWELQQIINEIKEYEEMHNGKLGMECDKQTWYNLIEWLEERI